MEKVLYSKSSDYRNRFTNLRTSIVEIDNKRYAKKESVFPEAQEHLFSLLDNQTKLKDIFEPDYNVCSCIKKGECVLFDYVDGKSLEQIVGEKIESGDIDGLISLIEEYHSLVWKMESSRMDSISERFYEVFGKQEFSDDTQFCNFGNIDLIFSNIIKRDKLCIIDYEWCFDFLIPLKYIFWRGLFTSYSFSLLDNKRKDDIFIRYELSPEDRTQFLNMEEHFVDFTMNGHISFNEEVKAFRNICYNVKNFCYEGKNYPISIFIKKDGNIIGEKHEGISYPGRNKFAFLVEDGDYDSIEVFLAPLGSIIRNISVVSLDPENEVSVPFTTTSDTEDSDSEYFLRNTPVIIIN